MSALWTFLALVAIGLVTMLSALAFDRRRERLDAAEMGRLWREALDE